MRVLIAHSSSAARAALAKVIRRDRPEELEIIESADGHDAVEWLLRTDSPGLAVVDWDMPGIDGPEICRLVRDFHLSRPPYMVLLAASSHPDTRDAFEAGADDCVSTPASAATLRACADEGLRSARAASDAEGGGRATLEAVCSRDNDGLSAEFYTLDDGQSAPATERHRSASLQALLSEH